MNNSQTLRFRAPISKEKNMKLRLPLLLAAVALLSVSIAGMAQEPTGKLHGRVTDPTGVPRGGGSVGLSTDGGKTEKYTFPVSETGDFKGDGIAPGTYSLILRMADTAPGKFVDNIDNVKIVAGQDMLQDDD